MKFTHDANGNPVPVREGDPVGGVFVPGTGIATNTWHQLMPNGNATKIDGQTKKLVIGDLRADIAGSNIAGWQIALLNEGYRRVYEVSDYSTLTTTEETQVEDTAAVAESVTERAITNSDFDTSEVTGTPNWRGTRTDTPTSGSRGDLWYVPAQGTFYNIVANDGSFRGYFSDDRVNALFSGDVEWLGNRSEANILGYFRSNLYDSNKVYLVYNTSDSEVQIVTYTAPREATYRTEYADTDTENVATLQTNDHLAVEISNLPDSIEFVLFPKMVLPFTLLNRSDSTNDVEIGYSPTNKSDNVIELTKKAPGESFVLPVNSIHKLFYRYAAIAAGDELEWGEHYST